MFCHERHITKPLSSYCHLHHLGLVIVWVPCLPEPLQPPSRSSYKVSPHLTMRWVIIPKTCNLEVTQNHHHSLLIECINSTLAIILLLPNMEVMYYYLHIETYTKCCPTCCWWWKVLNSMQGQYTWGVWHKAIIDIPHMVNVVQMLILPLLFACHLWWCCPPPCPQSFAYHN